jgi:hypothetical protein
VRDQVSHPYKTTGRIIVLYILISVFLHSKLGQKILNGTRHSLSSVCSYFFMNSILISQGCSQVFELNHTFNGCVICVVILSWILLQGAETLMFCQ